MRLGSKFFTPPLSESDRKALLFSFGLAEFSYGVVEQWEDKILSVKHFSSNMAQSSLFPSEVDDLPALFGCSDFPWVVVKHSGPSFAEEIPNAEGPLWKELFPSPLHRFLDAAKGLAVDFHPVGFGTALADVSLLFERLEKLLMKTEFSLLELRHGSVSQTLCFHHVRGRRVRVGLWKEAPTLSGEAPASGKGHPLGESTVRVLEIPTTFGGSAWHRLARALSLFLDQSTSHFPMNSPFRSKNTTGVVIHEEL